MPAIDYELHYLASAVEVLKTYLLSNELYWLIRLQPPSGKPAYPLMTPGNLLLFRTKLQGRSESGSLNSADKPTYLKLEERFDDLIQAWRSAWDKKVAKEFKSRFNQWKIILDEMSNDPGNRDGYYKSEVRARVLLELLAQNFRGRKPAELDLLSTLDQKLQVMTKDAKFLWEDELMGVFGRETYWFLYRMTK